MNISSRPAVLHRVDPRFGGVFAALLAPCMFALPAAAQCPAQWLPGGYSSPGLTGGAGTIVFALAVMPNGDLAAGGVFSTAGGNPASNIALWNGSVWSALGSGTPSTNGVYALVVLPNNGGLVAGGGFAAAGGVSGTRFVGRWKGAVWLPFGAGIGGAGTGVHALAVMPNGDIVAAGDFTYTNAAGVTVNRIVRWDGMAWNALGTGLNGEVLALTVLHNGDLVAGGVFTMAGGTPASRIARWNGAAWSAVGTEVANSVSGNVFSLAVLFNGDLVAGGDFTTAGGVPANRIARWNGAAWSALGSGMPTGQLFALEVLPNGHLAAGGSFTSVDSVSASRIARWDGAHWFALGSGVILSGLPTSTAVRALAVLRNGDLAAGGAFTVAGGLPADNIAHYTFGSRADFDYNGAIEPADVSLFVTIWFTGLTSGTLAGDFDGNGIVEPADVSLFVTTWFNALTNGC